jgi:hypothetical protein
MAFRRRNPKISVITLMLFAFAPVFAGAQVAWVKDFNTALKQAAAEKKFIVLDISASW